jgi:peptidoglycan-N-acetylmuramic acid deacetylase
MKKNIKSAIALSLILNLIAVFPHQYVSAANNEDVDANECFQEDGVVGDISDIDNIIDIFFLF